MISLSYKKKLLKYIIRIKYNTYKRYTKFYLSTLKFVSIVSHLVRKIQSTKLCVIKCHLNDYFQRYIILFEVTMLRK